MMSAASFSLPLGERPSYYRTPSPPRRAVEPITPSTAEFRASWAERGPPPTAVLENDQNSQNSVQPIPADPGRHQRSGHGRSNSTIDTLATIALATSPTFAPPPAPSSPDFRSTFPLFPNESQDSERPLKRSRSERQSSPYQSPPSSSHAPPPPSGSLQHSALDSMKTDAELLLNFARPSNFWPSGHHTKRVSIDESYHNHNHNHNHGWGSDMVRYDRLESSHASQPFLPEDRKASFNHSDNHIPPSRLRSRSDGSTFLSRPMIRGVRPTTSTGALPPVLWEEEEDDAHAAMLEDSRYVSYADQRHGEFDHNNHHNSTKVRPKVEEDMRGDTTNQASCAACYMVRIPVDSEEPLEEDTWIGCDGCKRWFHIVCAGFKNDREVRTVDKFICRACRAAHGQTTFVRKSSRARTAIDYAGLNQGLVKAASDSAEHHYLEPIRQGKIRFLPESFPRMRPELVTAEYFERGNGWTEPVVIPAVWNHREAVPELDEDFASLVESASTREMFDELLEHIDEHQTSVEETVDCGQDQLDMVVPQGLTVRAVAELYGPEERVEVIDVKSQQGEDKRWNMQKWADYYESNEPDKPVRNVISLEVSQSKLGRLIRRPKVVRDLDLQDEVWPDELKAIGDYPKVQFYCLMSVADCYTDFHIDFGGSSVYYHILKGKKTFFFIPPKDKHLKKYEEWCKSPAQDSVFLGNQTKECYRVDLSAGDTMLIPSGWIHAVWTPENSLVIGGNFLTRLNYGMQIKVLNIEKETKVPMKFRYPFFQKIQWYTALRYLEQDPVPQSVMDAFLQDENYRFHRQQPIYYEFGDHVHREQPGTAYYNARLYSQAELEGLPELTKYLLRTALIASSYNVEGVTVESRNAVRRSIPKGIADPVDMIRTFGIWVAWKRGNEKAPQWIRPGVIESNPKVPLNEKKSAGRPSRRSERNVDNQRTYAERQAVQRPSDDISDMPAPQINNAAVLATDESEAPAAPASAAAPAPASAVEVIVREPQFPSKPRPAQRGSGLGPKRVACDACRRRRIRCRHKDEPSDSGNLGAHVGMNGLGLASGLSNTSSLAQDAVSALNSLAAIASQAGFQSNGVVGFDKFDGPGKFHSTVLGASGVATNGLSELSPDGANGGKKGRSKACDDCRKSKRRCIHDEFGRVDPIKAQERSKPRGTAASKRPRPNEDEAVSAPSKKAKQESVSPNIHPLQYEDYQATAVLHDAQSAYDVLSHSHVQSSLVADVVTVGQALYASPPVAHVDSMDIKDTSALAAPENPTSTSLVSPPTSLVDEMDTVQDSEPVTSVESEALGALHTPNSSSRHSSRQPRHVERLVGEMPSSRSLHSATRPGASQVIPGPSTARKSSPRPSSSHAKKSSPMVEKHFDRHATTSLSPRQSKHNKNRTKEDADAESLRLIRELQEEEFGLRRRRG
ncbi:JmjC domain-containing histone demethylation protein 1 [Penicillium diatomitis]|uniref:JmjC domain-containing histone demethylation protein 1 n=1 Tax=Penicillium diatomitis TaxID=2819901 RepID=A0A9X0BMU4_9EURO|nr:JmjC domain-containing histone demethylation protein 1 [Penicillium diatomitis]KAJ5474985.1 JmjC domain-containing histone demethylation protein 1 [Penicillium diatomitis]